MWPLMIAGLVVALFAHNLPIPPVPPDTLVDKHWQPAMDARHEANVTQIKWIWVAIILCGSALYMLLQSQGRI
jgi:hypothetical protein